MKKSLFAIAIIATVSFASCTKENVAPTHKATVLADKANLGQADFNGDAGTGTGTVDDKANLGQADFGTGNSGN